MITEAPTLDRIFLGIIAGSGVGGLLVFIASAVANGSILSPAMYGLIAAFALLLLLPLIHVPIWLAVWAIGLRGALGACLAGSVSFFAALQAFNFLMAGQLYRPDEYFVGVIGIGAVMGFVIWRVAYWGVEKG